MADNRRVFVKIEAASVLREKLVGRTKNWRLYLVRCLDAGTLREKTLWLPEWELRGQLSALYVDAQVATAKQIAVES